MDIQAVVQALQRPPDATLSSSDLAGSFCGPVEQAARWLALNLDERQHAAQQLEGAIGGFWDRIDVWWNHIACAIAPGPSSDDTKERTVIDVSLALAKLERNLIAGIVDHQSAARGHESIVRRIIFHITTFTRIEAGEFFILQSIVTQLLSNIISPIPSDPHGSAFASECLDIYLSGNREDDIIIRLLDSEDVKVNESTLRLLSNVLRDGHDRQRRLLCPTGKQWMVRILGKMDAWHEHEDQRFSLSAGLIKNLIANGLSNDLFDLFSDSTEPITPSQAVFLKILDADLTSSDSQLYHTTSLTPSPNLFFLIKGFNELSRYALISMQSGRDDARLPKVFEGLILLSEALSSICLKAQEIADQGLSPLPPAVESIVNGAKAEIGGIVKSLVDVLRQLDTFLPRVKPAQRSQVPPAPPELEPVSNIKRNLVRLIGILAYDDTGVGDQVRHGEGVQLLLSMTEVDEANPFLREHALFAVRNLMKGNPANQAVIAEMDPVGVVSESGELLPLPERLRRQRNANGNASVSSPQANGINGHSQGPE